MIAEYQKEIRTKI